jgi:hypothetical protein
VTEGRTCSGRARARGGRPKGALRRECRPRSPKAGGSLSAWRHSQRMGRDASQGSPPEGARAGAHRRHSRFSKLDQRCHGESLRRGLVLEVAVEASPLGTYMSPSIWPPKGVLQAAWTFGSRTRRSRFRRSSRSANPRCANRSELSHEVPFGAARVLIWMATMRTATTEIPIETRNAAW